MGCISHKDLELQLKAEQKQAVTNSVAAYSSGDVIGQALTGTVQSILEFQTKDNNDQRAEKRHLSASAVSLKGNLADCPNSERDMDCDRTRLVNGFVRLYCNDCDFPMIPPDILVLCGQWISFITIGVGQMIDVRDRWGKWCKAKILRHKIPSDPLPYDMANAKKVNILNRFVEAVFVHYIEWDSKWDEWIIIDGVNLCECTKPCHTHKDLHRIAQEEWQSKYEDKSHNQMAFAFHQGLTRKR